MKRPSWKIAFGALTGATVLGLALANSQRIQAAAVSASEAQTPQVFSRKFYTANLTPLNGSGVTGTARVILDGNHMGIDLDATGLDPTIPHPQFLRPGTACPNRADDTNRDGFVDAVEINRSSGPPVLPLTLSGNPLTVTQSSPTPTPTSTASPIATFSPLATSTPAASPTISAAIETEDFPLPSPSGHLIYIQTFPQSTLESAFPPLPGASPTSGPSPTSSPASGVDLADRVITIQGFAPGTLLQLPQTLGTILGLPAEATLPVACGVLSVQTE